MAFKFDKAEEGYSSKLDIFKVPPVDTSIYKQEWMNFRPVNPITKGSPIQFTISSASSDYRNLKKMMLHVKCKILKADGKAVDDKDKVAFVNLTLHSLFKQVDVALQQTVVNPSVGQNHSYKSMMDILLNYEEDPKETFIQAQGFYKDTAGSMDDVDPEEGSNLGVSERWLLTKTGQVLDLEGPLYSDICQQNRLLINGVQMDVKLYPNSDNFVLMGAAASKFSYEIEECVLKVCHVKVNPALVLAHAESLKKSPALYPYTRSDFRTFNIQPGSYTWSMDDLFQGQIPSRVVVALVSGKAYSGAYDKNPYNFSHHNCNFMALYADGQSVPGEPFQCNYKKGHYVSSYLSLFTAGGKQLPNQGNFISRDEYANGNCMYVFNLEGKTNKEHMQLLKRGHTRLSIRFDKTPTETLTVLVYSHFPAVLQIDEARNIIL